ncbi:50S ribosomal protein L4 [Piedraia hortae CBS 480.64]|uniref:Large ribosomal subunit protein uL4m n=1 Tax=Piedraia hortae CBS 480.64 TaxID=1314780 RepID=A0A6A7BXS8_9PEZI|nr:50S ribosomal protein L4 [Piedraia hortae CBS 480.64]
MRRITTSLRQCSRLTTETFPSSYSPPPNPFITSAATTIHAFPSFEPKSVTNYPSTHLLLPLRKDILHRAVIYEGDNARQGTASTKWRSEVHGSGRKIRPQKGTGSARLGDKKSPMLRGGGVAFGPKPRDFGTNLPAKLYDLAWRTALSYRYAKGELIVVEGEAELEGIAEDHLSTYLKDVLQHNKMGHANGRTMFLTCRRNEGLFEALKGEKMGREAIAKDVSHVDVKNLLELGRLVVEQRALDLILTQHESDLSPDQRLRKWRERTTL